MPGRELLVEIALAGFVLAGAVAWPVVAGVHDVAWGTAALLVVAYAISASALLYVGAGCALATQLAFVPMLWLLPAPLVPLCVVAALLLWALPDVVRRRHSPQRLLTAVGNAGYAFAPAVVFAVAAPSWRTALIALVAQCALDSALSIAREWLGRGIAPTIQLAVMGSVYGVDALLLPVAVAIAEQAEEEPLMLLAIVPLSLLLAALAHDRTRRIDESVARLEELQRERERVNVAIHRVGRSLGAGHDRIVVLEVALGTAVDAVDAAAGRARLSGIPRALEFEAVPGRPGAARAAALDHAERAALAGRVDARADDDGWYAVANPLRVPRDGREAIIGAMAVCRPDAPFSAEDEVLFGYLTAQAAASIQSIDLHDRLRSGLSLDAQTGLANRARFRDLLEDEVRRATAAGSPLALLVVGLDRLDRHGSELADVIVRSAGQALRDRSRVLDEPARVRDDRFGVLLPGARLDAARIVGDDIRSAIAALAVPWDGGVVRPTASVGVAVLAHPDLTREALLLAAERALGEAQAAGGNLTHTLGADAVRDRRSAFPR